MSNCSPRKLGARFLILSLFLSIFSVFNMGSTLAAQNRGAAPANTQSGNSQSTGQLIANGPVTVNGNKAITGTTVFNDSNVVVDCAKGNSAIVNLGKLGRVELVAGTKMTLRFSNGLISGNIQDGKAVIKTPEGVKVEVNTPDGGVVTSNCVKVQECVTPVAVQGFTQCVPVVAAAPVPVPVVGGVSGWVLAGALAGTAGGAAAFGAISANDEDIIPVPVVSPTMP
ncbi:MAG TPA: hypothetical protein VJZ77_17370 [Blastocatellia bacterium]|nr:hypothetical protein [Blastocatellia bacterium]